MNGLKHRRIQIARWLLTIFVPMLVLTALHRHEAVAAEHVSCEACVHHIPHGGHLTATDYSVHDCVVCQLAGLPFMAAAVVTAVVLTTASITRLPRERVLLMNGRAGITRGRAPPAGF